MDKAKVIIAICILTAGLFGYVIGKQSTRISQTTNTQLDLPYEQVKIVGVDSAQQKQIEELIDKFYKYQYEREIDKLLALFMPAANKKEQDDLDFLLGKDYAVGNEKPLPRLFSTQGYGFRVVAHYVRVITTQNGTTTVLVDEMRIMYSGGEYVGYSSKITRLILEVKNVANSYKIGAYYYIKTNKNNLKYEGFSVQ